MSDIDTTQTATGTPATEPGIQDAMKQVLRKGSNKEVALIADNPDGTADVLVVRGDSGSPECYWFSVGGNVMSPLLKGLVGKSLNMTETDFATDAGLYRYIATVAGVAACFQANIPGIVTKEAFFGPLDYSIYKFVLSCGGFSTYETTFIKRNRNLAYKYRKACEAISGQGTPKATGGTMSEEISDAELASALGLDDGGESLI